MKKEITTALSPNLESDDVALAQSLLRSPKTWRVGTGPEELQTILSERLSIPNKHVYTFESARTALYGILSCLDLRPTDEVLLQAFTCVAVPAPVLWIGARPVYVDTRESDFTMCVDDLKRKITPASRVLIIQHTFGIPARMEELLHVAKEHGLFVIEDCAHTFASTYKRALLGTLGDAAIMSFGRDKALSSVFGGVATTTRPEIATRLRAFHGSCPMPSRSWVAQQLIHPLLTFPMCEQRNRMIVAKSVFALAKRAGVLSKSVYPIERSGGRPPFAFRKLPNALAQLALHQLEKLDRLTEHRKKLSSLYERELDLRRVILPKPPQESTTSFVRYPIRVRNAPTILDAAKTNRIHLGDWYTSPIAPEGVEMDRLLYTRGSCPVAERLSGETINLPTSIHIRTEDALRIVACIHEHADQL